MESFVLKAYWKSRTDSAEGAANKISQTLVEIKLCSEMCNKWFRQSDELDLSLSNQIDTSVDGILSEINTATKPKVSVIDFQSGYRIGFWNEISDNEYVSIEFGVGINGISEVLNSIILEFYDVDDARHETVLAGGLCILEKIVAIWKPDWGVFSTRAASMSTVNGVEEARHSLLSYISDDSEDGQEIAGQLNRLKSFESGGLYK